MNSVTLNPHLDQAVNSTIANFTPEDKAPAGLLNINFSGFGVSMLFNNTETVLKQVEEIKKENPDVIVTTDGHGYVLRVDYTKVCEQDPESSQEAVYNFHEIVARALAKANDVPLVCWVEIHSKANNMWFTTRK